MVWRMSLGFLIASLLQAGVVFAAERLGVSNLGPGVPLWVHILIGQIAGYLLYAVVRLYPRLRNHGATFTGVIYGTALWAIVLSIAASLGRVNAPWQESIGTVLASLLAFIVYGYTVARTVILATLMVADTK